jgi:Bifunctional DNA primase/polymerase, N-terminal
MPNSIYDPNPHISILDDGLVKKQIAEQAKRALEMADRMKELPPLTAEQIEAERFAYESNAYAAENALYSAARSAAVNFLVVPLDGATPLVEPSEATREPRKLLTWWAEYPSANPGVLLGRSGGLFALRVEGNQAWELLKEMAAVPMRDPDTDRKWTEHKPLGGAQVRLLAPSEPFSVRSRGGWGRDFDRAVRELEWEARDSNPQTFFLVYSYPPVQSGMDAFDYKSRTIATGLRLFGEGEVLPWTGSVLQDGVTVQAPMSRPPEAPLWLAKTIGKPRSRKAMAAAREAYNATIRAQEAYWTGIVAAQKAAGERAMREALAERERATKALARYEREAESEAG